VNSFLNDFILPLLVSLGMACLQASLLVGGRQWRSLSSYPFSCTLEELGEEEDAHHTETR
jgi:hypothetical protein